MQRFTEGSAIQLLLALIFSVVGCGRNQESSSELNADDGIRGDYNTVDTVRPDESATPEAEDLAELGDIADGERIVTFHVRGGAAGEGCNKWDLTFYSAQELGRVSLFKFRRLEERRQGDQVEQKGNTVVAHLTLVGMRDVIKLRVPDGSAIIVSGKVTACDGTASTFVSARPSAAKKHSLATVWTGPESAKKVATPRLRVKVSKTRNEAKLDKRQERFADRQDRKDDRQEKREAKKAAR